MNKKGGSLKAVNMLKIERSLCQFPSSSSSSLSPPEQSLPDKPDDVFLPFIMKGSVSLTASGPKVPVILRDSAASQSVILKGVLPLSETSSTESAALVCGFDMQVVGVPLHTVYLDSELVTGLVVVGVREAMSITVWVR